MNDNTICIFKDITLPEEEEKRILGYLNNLKAENFTESDEAEIIKKEELQNHSALRIEHRKHMEGIPFLCYGIGLIDVKVDNKENTVTGIRVLRCRGEYQFQKRTYNLLTYGKQWRAWTRIPKDTQGWEWETV